MAGARKDPRPPQRLILDSGAVIALSRGDAKARAFLARALEFHTPVEIPVVVLAETLRGGPRDALLNRVLKAVATVPELRAIHGRVAGQLLGETRSAATVDALVVAAGVVARGAQILTGDPDDLGRLAAGHPEVWIQPL